MTTDTQQERILLPVGVDDRCNRQSAALQRCRQRPGRPDSLGDSALVELTSGVRPRSVDRVADLDLIHHPSCQPAPRYLPVGGPV